MLAAFITVAATVALRPADRQAIFQRVAPSVFVVEVLDGKGSRIALGSGVALDAGIVITNYHVVAPGAFFKLHQAGRTWSAVISRCDIAHDLCLLSADRLRAPPARLPADPDAAVRPGDPVFAVGAFQMLELRAVEGVISGWATQDGYAVIQTSVTPPPSSSGGGLFDQDANLIGIATATVINRQVKRYAIPLDWVEALRALPVDSPAGDKPLDPNIQTVCVQTLGKNADAGQARQLVVEQLVSSNRFAVRDRCQPTDATIKGTLSDSSIALELVDRGGGVVWSGAEPVHHLFTPVRRALPDAVSRIVLRLIAGVPASSARR